ncbi:MAG: hypothetical protein J6Y32_03255 [Bacteroidales bacterium]|nr:hypothetical protein [Bacteroidales bacterium]
MHFLFIFLQLALSTFSRNPELSAGNLCGYFPQDTLVSEAPAGYQAFYISHIARHGSRYLDKRGMTCFQAIDTLTRYADNLTDDGRALMEDLKMFRDLSIGNEGALTPLGAREHRQICARMTRHYPEVFSDGRRSGVVAYSTTSPRAIASMKAFLGELNGRVPGLSVQSYETNFGKDARSREVTGREYLIKGKRKEKVNSKREELLAVGNKILEGRRGYEVFASRIFQDPSRVPVATVENLAWTSFRALKLGRVTEPATMPGMGKYFTPEELYRLWVPSCIVWLRYVHLPGYDSPLAREVGGGIKERLVKDADQAIRRGSTTAATLRFSHDTSLLPLMSALSLEGAVFECPETELMEYFQNYNVICPACNVQLVFYRSDSGPVLVKILLNEKETLIHGLAPDTGCFYDWNRVKRFWAKGRS